MLEDLRPPKKPLDTQNESTPLGPCSCAPLREPVQEKHDEVC